MDSEGSLATTPETTYQDFSEPHTREKIFYESEEFTAVTADERNLGNLTYLEILAKIKSNEIDASSLGMRILKRLQVVDLVSKRGVLAHANISVPTHDFLSVINEFNKNIKLFVNVVEFEWAQKTMVLLSEIITEFGLCTSFNLAPKNDTLDVDRVSSDFHYTFFHHNRLRKNVHEIVPRRTSTSLEGLIADPLSDEDFIANVVNTEINGYQLLLHDPYELPSRASQKIALNMGYNYQISVEPQISAIDDSLIDDEPQERMCYLEEERELDLLKVYTKVNCEAECLTRFMIARCECVEFFMIRNATTRVCSASEKPCYDDARIAFEDYRGSCGCLQPCDYVKYNLKIDAQRQHSSVFFAKIYSRMVRSKATIKFRQNAFNQLIRKKQFDVIDFLSFVGGVLGLFAGFSVLSFVELLYALTVGLLARICVRRSRIRPVMVVAVVDAGERSEPRFAGIFRDFFENSSIHGAGHFIGTRSVERVFWMFSLTLSLSASCYLISKVNQKLPDSRVIGHDDNMQFVDNIPFPAVTFVPDHIINQEYYLNFIRKKPQDIAGMIKDDPESYASAGICINKFSFGIARDNVTDTIMEAYAASSQAEWFRQQFASFGSKFQVNFTAVRTLRGIGFTFNLMDAPKMLNLNEHVSNMTMLNQARFKSIPSAAYPLKVDSTGKMVFSLKLAKLAINETLFAPCIPASFLIHAPSYLPTFHDLHYFTDLHAGTTMNIEVSPEIITTEATLKRLSPETRECYFEGEKPLRYFNTYTLANCEIECFTNATIALCNCVALNQPYARTDFIEKCAREGFLQCSIIARRGGFYQKSFSIERNCSCLPRCDSVSYHISSIAETNDENASIINVRINTEGLVVFRRYQQFTFSDEVSYVGGLLGLFAGISMLSIIEVVYFFTLRLLSNFWRGCARPQTVTANE